MSAVVFGHAILAHCINVQVCECIITHCNAAMQNMSYLLVYMSRCQQLEYCMGRGIPTGFGWVFCLGMGLGMGSCTHELQNKPWIIKMDKYWGVYNQLGCFSHNLTILDDLGFVLTRKLVGSWVKPTTGMCMGTAKNCQLKTNNWWSSRSYGFKEGGQVSTNNLPGIQLFVRSIGIQDKVNTGVFYRNHSLWYSYNET